MENKYSNTIKRQITKTESIPMNNLNNTIACYHRPHLNKFIYNKNETLKKMKKKRSNINNNNTKNVKNIKFYPKIETRKIKFSKNNSFDKHLNTNKENINLNTNIKPYPNVIHKTKSLINTNSKNIYIRNLKYKNVNKIKNKSNNNINDLLISTNYNKKNSISKDIAILCKIINSINSKTNNKNISRNLKNEKKIIYNNSRKKYVNISYYKKEKIIIIQKWWRKMLYQFYIEKYILIIQRFFRQFLKKKKKWIFDYENQMNIKKIIIIQKAWRKYVKNKCLNNYYFFSFKKYMKSNKKEDIINNIKNVNESIPDKDKMKNQYITKSYYKTNHINHINYQVKKLQKKIKQFLWNNNKTKYLLINLIHPPIIEQSYITKIKKCKTFFINKDIITKTSIIQKNIKKYFMSKKNVFTFSNNNNEKEDENENENEQIIIIKAKEIMGQKFSNYISYKLSQCFMLVLNKINIFNFIKMYLQRIKKNINQYVFIKIYCYYKNENTKFDNINNISYFFQVLWRHIKISINTNNEISLLLKQCIPKYFHKDFSKKYIPYINSTQEKKLIDTQLFLYNNNELIKYIFYFYEKEKQNNLNFNENIIKNHLNKYNLLNRNIFSITRYIDCLYKDILNKKIKVGVIIGKNIHLNNKLNILNDINDNFTIEDNCYHQTEENIYDDINNDNKNNENFNRINTDYIIKKKYSNTKKFNCKFIDYLNKSSK